MKKRCIGALAAAGLIGWVALVTTGAYGAVIYFDDGTQAETDKDIYLSDTPLYNIKGGLKTEMKVTPAKPTVTAPAVNECTLPVIGFGSSCTSTSEPTEETTDPDNSITFG